MSLELNECISLKTCKNECKNNNKMDTSDLNAYINIINRFTNENQQFDDRIKCINFTMSYKEQKKTQKCDLMILNGWPDITTLNIYTMVFRVKLLKNRTRNMQHHIYVVDYRMTL